MDPAISDLANKEDSSIKETTVASSQEKDTEPVPSASENTNLESQKRLQKAKKRKPSLRDANAPKHPLSGYLRFSNARREELRTTNPELNFVEITRILASEWSILPSPEKQKYLTAAEEDKQRYQKELQVYKQSESYKQYTKKQQEKKKKKEEVVDITLLGQETNSAGFDIPIFTEDFLDHNKARESELRQLRKTTTEYEEQNAILQKHIDNMKAAIEKLESEMVQQRNTNLSIQQHLNQLRTSLTSSFSGVSLPGVTEPPTLETIDGYMAKLHSLAVDSPQEHESLLSTVRDIVSRIDIPA